MIRVKELDVCGSLVLSNPVTYLLVVFNAFYIKLGLHKLVGFL